MIDIIKLKLPTKPEYVSLARLAASSICTNIGFDIDDIEDIKVSLGEACNNAVIHSESDKEFDVNFYIYEDKLEIEVIDYGKGFDLDSYKEPDLKNLKGSGLGIYLIKSLMDDIEINKTDNGTKLKFLKYIG